MKCHIFHGFPQKVQDDLSAFLEGKKHIKIQSLVQSQNIIGPLPADDPKMILTITILYTEVDNDQREHILGFNARQ